MSEHLKEGGVEYDGLIAEIAKEPESDFDAVKLELFGAVREIKKQALMQELNQLFSSGLTSDQIGVRYREITAIQNQFKAEEDA
jgi:DNA primase